MKSWNIYITFFKKLYDDHYLSDHTFNKDNFTFVKVNDDYDVEIADNKLDYNLLFEHDFDIYNPVWQQKGYHENSVLHHVYQNKSYLKHDYVGFMEYDHVLNRKFCKNIQHIIDESDEDLIFSFETFSYKQLWEQGIVLNPFWRSKQEGRANSRWNCINVILKQYNKFYGTEFTLDDLKQKNCFPICHAVLMPSHIFEKIMRFHSFIMESGQVEKYHSFNWRSNAGLMERYLAVELSLEKAQIISNIQLEHRSYNIKVVKPEWSEQSLFKKFKNQFLRR